MKRLSVAATVIGASFALAAPSSADPVVVCTPAADAANEHAAENNKAPDPTIKAILPDNPGTNNGAGHSPSLIFDDGARGEPCTPDRAG